MRPRASIDADRSMPITVAPLFATGIATRPVPQP